MQVDMLFGVCHLLADSGSVDGNHYQDWGLFEIDVPEMRARRAAPEAPSDRSVSAGTHLCV
jgi:hypothetical protein